MKQRNLFAIEKRCIIMKWLMRNPSNYDAVVTSETYSWHALFSRTTVHNGI